MDHICVIHSPARTDREALLRQEVASQGLQWSDIELRPAIFEGSPATGISKAHRAVVAHAKAQGWPSVAIWEDDIMFTHPTSWARYKAIAAQLPPDWDLYFGGASSWPGSPRKLGPPANAPQLIGPAGQDISGAHCYTVNAKFYDKFLGAPNDTHIDRWFVKRGKAKSYACWPFVAMQHNGYSDQQKRVLSFESLNNKFQLWTG